MLMLPGLPNGMSDNGSKQPRTATYTRIKCWFIIRLQTASTPSMIFRLDSTSPGWTVLASLYFRSFVLEVATLPTQVSLSFPVNRVVPFQGGILGHYGTWTNDITGR